MSADRITMDDLRRALEQHAAALAAAGITYDGRLGIDEGSKTYGRAFRLYRTGYLMPDRDGTMTPTSGHGNPPVGSDYLGMTKREAYDELTGRTRVLWDVAAARRDQATSADTVTRYGFARTADGYTCGACDASWAGPADGSIMRGHRRRCPVAPADFPTPGVCDS
jgi:hypothetical protein